MVLLQRYRVVDAPSRLNGVFDDSLEEGIIVSVPVWSTVCHVGAFYNVYVVMCMVVAVRLLRSSCVLCVVADCVHASYRIARSCLLTSGCCF